MTRDDLGKMLKLQRVMIPMTLQELAAASGVSSSHLGRIERGERLPSASTLRKIAKPLGFSEAELFTQAGFLSKVSTAVESEAQPGRLDPYVAGVLALEPVATQRAVIGLLSILKSLAPNLYNIEFTEYAHRKYPELDEDIITMAKDIIEHPPKGKGSMTEDKG